MTGDAPHKTVRSSLGVHFTSSSLPELGLYCAVARRAGDHLAICIGRTPDGEVDVNVIDDFDPDAPALDDRIGGVTFRWYADVADLERLADFVVDLEYGRKSRVIPREPR